MFDHDGTLWSEQPMYVQMLFAFDRVRALAGEHRDWRNRQPFQAVPEGDMKALAAGCEAPERGWSVIGMRSDWKVVFAPR